MFQFWRKKSANRENEQLRKMQDGHQAMRAAITSTTDAADGLVGFLRADMAPQDSDALLLCDANGSIQRCNPGAKQMFNVDATNHSIKDFLYPDGDPLDKVWSSMFSNPGNKSLMIGIRDGESFPVEVSITRMDSATEAPKVLVFVRYLDIKPSAKEKKTGLQAVADSAEETMAAIKRRT